MTIGKRKGFAAKGAGAAPGQDSSKRVGGSLSKNDHFYIQEAYGMTFDPGVGQMPGMEASGGIVSDRTDPDGKIYRTHVFTTAGKFVVTENHHETNPPAYGELQMLLVGGGGGGGGNVGGGGGAGGVWTNHPDMPAPRRQPSITVSKTGGPTNNGQYPISIGSGGMGQYATQPGDTPIGDGSNSVFGSGSPPTNGATGGWGSGGFGGSGASPGNAPVRQGPGSAGGGTGYPSAPTNNTGLAVTLDPKQGFPSGVGGFNPYSAGGGGGAGGAGINGGSPASPGAGDAANGGDGVLIGILASPPTVNSGAGFYWGGGGGGANLGQGPASRAGSGGKGGGGGAGTHPTGGGPAPGGADGLWAGEAGSVGPSDNAGTGRGGDGAECTGGGGGGSCHNNGQDGVFGGNGGSGICILRYQIGEVDTKAAKATGGSVSFYNNKTIHTYFHTGTFTTPATFNETCEYVVLAGGGGGAGDQGGGGGAGQYLTATTPIGASQSFAVTVGAGGMAGNASPIAPGGHATGKNGTNSVAAFPAGTITAAGGGGGGGWNTNGGDGVNGGSGSGAAGPGTNGGTATPGPGGNDGGAGASNRSGGGGGAGGAGQDASAPANGAGGTGIELPATFRNPEVAFNYYPNADYTPAPSVWWVAAGGGGAGATGASPADGALGGAGGGGIGGGPTTGDPNSYGPGYRGGRAVQFTGSGGGGGPYTSGGSWPNRKPGGAGGCGIVMIAYPT